VKKPLTVISTKLAAFKRASAARKVIDIDAYTRERDRLDEPINAALAEVNGKASAFAIYSAERIRRIAEMVEQRLADDGVPFIDRVDITVLYTPAGPATKSYRYGVISTSVLLQRNANGSWVLYSMCRTMIAPGERETLRVNIPPRTRDAIVKHALRLYNPIAERAS
jgi:hypothetical protein